MDMNIPHDERGARSVFEANWRASNLNMNKFREDRKDDRTKSKGQQSKLIDQRSKDKEPLDFENDFIWRNDGVVIVGKYLYS
jgi:hypothetical protein